MPCVTLLLTLTRLAVSGWAAVVPLPRQTLRPTFNFLNQLTQESRGLTVLGILLSRSSSFDSFGGVKVCLCLFLNPLKLFMLCVSMPRRN